MGLQDRDYMNEKTRAREEKSKKLNALNQIHNINEKYQSKTKILNKTTLIGTIVLILITKGPGLIKGIKIPLVNPAGFEPIKINTITPQTIKPIQQQANTGHKSRICKILKNGNEECTFI